MIMNIGVSLQKGFPCGRSSSVVPDVLCHRAHVAVAVLNHQTNFPAATSTRAAATTWWRGDGVHTQKRDDNSRSHSNVVVVAVRNYLNNTVSDVIQGGKEFTSPSKTALPRISV